MVRMGYKYLIPDSGAVKGVNFSDNGSLFIVPRSDGFADLSGHAVITTVKVLNFSIQPQGANLALLIIWWQYSKTK